MALASVEQPGEFLQAASAVPESAAPATTAPACGGCYLVADVSLSINVGDKVFVSLEVFRLPVWFGTRKFS